MATTIRELELLSPHPVLPLSGAAITSNTPANLRHVENISYMYYDIFDLHFLPYIMIFTLHLRYFQSVLPG